ncbi:AI-2E family transporter [Hydrogenibacillus sp. N12]|uniref:AI-2E family transporter n=1 Tax=Hydrogenibacillus sp. N12 TaxID=2866627 RepID=UPI001C7D7412|nr:AI-2E family transporter [Hydrogenibacillus sp. N12]QZA32325.1 AI-2E family transporter [Hydrogenibacillus sp. N12]
MHRTVERRPLERRAGIGLLWIVGVLVILWLWQHVGAGVFWLLGFVGRLLLPLWFALILTYLIHPIVRRLEGWGLGRSAALRLTFLLVLLGGAVSVVAAAPAVIRQVELFERALPTVFTTLFEELEKLEARFDDGWPTGVRRGFERLQGLVNRAVERGIVHLSTLTDDAFEWLMTFSLSPFIAYYLLKDSRGFLELVASLFPRRLRPRVVEMLVAVDRDIGDYVAGQLLISFLLGALTFVGYLIIGFPYPLVFAAINMVANLIPFIGPFLGALPALVIAATVGWPMVAWVLVVNVVAQFVENNVLSPLITGRATEMHPLVVIFAVLVGGEVAGILGMIFAVPVAVIVRHVVRAFWPLLAGEAEAREAAGGGVAAGAAEGDGPARPAAGRAAGAAGSDRGKKAAGAPDASARADARLPGRFSGPAFAPAAAGVGIEAAAEFIVRESRRSGRPFSRSDVPGNPDAEPDSPDDT